MSTLRKNQLKRLIVTGYFSHPEFKTISWFAMLFSAGMGIGILLWNVGEPLLHYINYPKGIGKTVEAVQTSMQLTILHWGLHAWGVYALVGMSLTFLTFNKKLPLSNNGHPFKIAPYNLIPDSTSEKLVSYEKNIPALTVKDLKQFVGFFKALFD